MERPSLTPDLNPIKNLWAIVENKGEKNYAKKEVLINRISKCGVKCRSQYVTLVLRMKNRAKEVKLADGGGIHY